jgi:hypothetical protein
MTVCPAHERQECLAHEHRPVQVDGGSSDAALLLEAADVLTVTRRADAAVSLPWPYRYDVA